MMFMRAYVVIVPEKYGEGQFIVRFSILDSRAASTNDVLI